MKLFIKLDKKEKKSGKFFIIEHRIIKMDKELRLLKRKDLKFPQGNDAKQQNLILLLSCGASQMGTRFDKHGKPKTQ